MSQDFSQLLRHLREQASQRQPLVDLGHSRHLTPEEFRRWLKNTGGETLDSGDELLPDDFWMQYRRVDRNLNQPSPTGNNTISELLDNLLKGVVIFNLGAAPFVLSWYLLTKKRDSQPTSAPQTLATGGEPPPQKQLLFQDAKALLTELGLKEKRAKELVDSIQQSQILLHGLEQRRIVVDDPREAARLDLQIADLRLVLQGFYTEQEHYAPKPGAAEAFPIEIRAEAMLVNGAHRDETLKDTTFLKPLDSEAQVIQLFVFPDQRKVYAGIGTKQLINLGQLPISYLAKLDTGTESEQIEAAHLLSFFGPLPSAILVFRRLVQFGSPLVRRVITDVASEWGTEETHDILRYAIQDKTDPIVRNIAAASLARANTPENTEALWNAVLQNVFEPMSNDAILIYALSWLEPYIIKHFDSLTEAHRHHLLTCLKNGVAISYPYFVDFVTEEVEGEGVEVGWKLICHLIDAALQQGVTTSAEAGAVLQRGIASAEYQTAVNLLYLTRELPSVADAMTVLKSGFQHSNYNIRAYAGAAIGKYFIYKSPDAIPALLQAYEQETHLDAKSAIGSWLGGKKPKTRKEKAVKWSVTIASIFFCGFIAPMIFLFSHIGYDIVFKAGSPFTYVFGFFVLVYFVVTIGILIITAIEWLTSS